MKRVLEIVTISLFFLFVGGLGLSALLFQNESDISKIFSFDKNPIVSADKYISQNFPLCSNWNTLYAKASSALGQHRFSDIYYISGSDSEDSGDGERLVSVIDEVDEQKIDLSVKSVNDFFADCKGISVYAMIVPTSSGIYSADLPDSLGEINQQKLIDEIYYDIDSEITPIDVWSALYSVRSDYVYYRTDSRWTQQGAFEAYRVCAVKMGFSVYGLENYDIDYTHVSFSGKLAEQSGISSVEPDTINACRCKYGSYVKSTKILRDTQTYTKSSVYSSAALQNDDKYSYFLGQNLFKCAQIETAGEDLPTILVVGSDYANCFVPFLAPHFSKITVINPAALEDGEAISDFADPEDYDKVLFLFDLETFVSGCEFN